MRVGAERDAEMTILGISGVAPGGLQAGVGILTEVILYGNHSTK